MLDHLCINIPFDESLVSCDKDGKYAFVDFDPYLLDLPLAARAVHRNDDESISATSLFHPYESLPTHYTGMAVKCFFDSAYFPYVQIKASPAKLLQGHNVFGTDDIEQGADEMIGYLWQAYPVLCGLLHFPSAWVSHIDVTYSARVKTQDIAQKCIDFLSRVSNGQTRLSNKKFDTSVYWGGSQSRLLNLKCYLKYDEFIAQFENQKELAKKGHKSAQRVVDVMSNPKLLDWAVGLLRFEARLKKRWLERNNIPTNLFDLIAYQKQNPDFLQQLWQKAMGKLFEALRGQEMKITDDSSVLQAIEQSDVVKNAKGKVSAIRVRNLFAAYCLIREKGLDEIKTTFSKASFHRLVADLCLCGFSKAYLQNLHDEKAKNVVPFVRLIEIDFNQQLPHWYQPSVSQFAA